MSTEAVESASTGTATGHLIAAHEVAFGRSTAGSPDDDTVRFRSI